jgi:hypothetical protein
MKLTKWFRNGEKPVHVGVYQRKYPWGVNYAYFDGESWALAADSIGEAKQWGKYSKTRVLADDLLWRGVIKQ